MPTTMTEARYKIIDHYKSQYPLTNNEQLISMMLKEKALPEITSYNSLRNLFRLYYIEKEKEPKTPFENLDLDFDESFDIDIRVGISNKRTPYLVPSAYKRILVISDIHAPYHDANALKLALKYGWDNGVQMIIINGDFLDCYPLSRFDKNPNSRNMAYEVEVGRTMLQNIKQKFPNTKIVYKFGNHEDRMQSYLTNRAQELYQLEEVWLENLLKLREIGIDYVESKDIIHVDDLRIIHGHEIKAGGSVNVQRSIFLKTYMNTLAGHFHREGKSIINNLDGKLKGSWTNGCLCDLSPDYMPYNQWNHGFAWIERDNGTFTVALKTIINGKVL